MKRFLILKNIQQQLTAHNYCQLKRQSFFRFSARLLSLVLLLGISIHLNAQNCSRSASVTNIKLNGGGTTITVNPGASVELSLDYELKNGNVDCPSCIHQILVGYESEVLDCIYSGVPRVCPAKTTGSYSKAITAPTEPGTYDIYRTHHLTYTCEQAEAQYAGKGKTKIATITVKCNVSVR